VLVVLSVVDFERRILPNRILLPAIAVVLAAQVAIAPERALEWVLAAVGAALVLFLARHGLSARKRPLPYGPFLAFGGIVVLLLADPG
jgi:prepilin signal peptidase PulO-like enzyme (type II secretory pathway)